MCGIAGFISFTPEMHAMPLLKKMTTAIAHRGPDGEAFYSNPSGHAHFGHRRLCIIDPSPLSVQPMHYTGRYTILHNGEIYNYIELRKDLEKKGCVFKTNSDTEVIVAAYHLYRDKALELFDGMFAFVIWDEQEKQLFLARDRFGEKPLFFYADRQNNRFVFGSEMKALWAYGLRQATNNRLLLQFLALGYKNEVENVDTYDDQVLQLPPAHFGIVSLASNNLNPEITTWWDLDKETTVPVTPATAIEQFHELLQLSVQRRLRSDVTVGATLSGGLDSSSIVAMMASHTIVPPSCYSAVFPGFKKDEQLFIEALQTRYALQTHFISPTAEVFIAEFEKLLYHQEQPISSSSVYAQYKVFELAKKNNTSVLLDGQGADEILAGYPKYIPVYLREIIKNGNVSFNHEKKAFEQHGIKNAWSWKQLLAAKFPGAAASFLLRREKIKLHHAPWITAAYREANNSTGDLYKPVIEKLNDVLYYNTRQNGLPELLRYADRNAMAHGRETRFPFLSHELVKFVFSLPSTLKIHEGWTKWLLRTTMAQSLPPSITWRKEKIAFEPPQLQWMETKKMQEYIMAAREKLVKEKIARKEVLEKKIQPHDAYAAENSDWRMLVAATVLK